MKRKYVSPEMTNCSPFLFDSIAANEINLGSGTGGDGKIDNPGTGGYEGGAKERYDDGVVYGNIW